VLLRPRRRARGLARPVSWDLLIIAAPPGLPVEAVTEDNTPPLGPRADVVAAIRAALPEAGEPSGRYLRVEGETFTVELNLGDDEPVGHLGVRAQGDDATVDALMRLCAHTGWRAYDVSTGDFLDAADDPAAGLRGWRALRDRAIGDG
jgi:hypothetical protein